MAEPKKEKTFRERVREFFSAAQVAPGSASNRTLESTADKLQEAIGAMMKKKKPAGGS